MTDKLKPCPDTMADEVSIHAYRFDDGRTITQCKPFLLGDSHMVVLCELNYPNVWYDEAFDRAEQSLLQAWNTRAEPAQQSADVEEAQRLSKALNALANDAENTDGWQGAVEDLKAASMLLATPPQQKPPRVAEGEICRAPRIIETHDKSELTAFDDDHTINDVLRWLAEQAGSMEDVRLHADMLCETRRRTSDGPL